MEGGSNTALHLCAFHDKPECMKLLLRSGADFSIKNGQDKTPLEIAQEKGHKTCEDLVSSVLALNICDCQNEIICNYNFHPVSNCRFISFFF